MEVNLSHKEVADLPDELLKELGFNQSDRKDLLILQIFLDSGGVASVNQILIEIFKRTGDVEKRTRLVSRLYKMQKKRIIFPHAFKKGVYVLPEAKEQT